MYATKMIGPVVLGSVLAGMAALRRHRLCEVLRERAERVYAVANEPRFAESWSVYPFNSGYFMCVKVSGVDAEQVRLHLLEHHGIGVRLGPLLPLAYGEESFRLLQTIKHALDPDDLMNPGKLGL